MNGELGSVCLVVLITHHITYIGEDIPVQVVLGIGVAAHVVVLHEVHIRPEIEMFQCVLSNRVLSFKLHLVKAPAPFFACRIPEIGHFIRAHVCRYLANQGKVLCRIIQFLSHGVLGCRQVDTIGPAVADHLLIGRRKQYAHQQQGKAGVGNGSACRFQFSMQHDEDICGIGNQAINGCKQSHVNSAQESRTLLVIGDWIKDDQQSSNNRRNQGGQGNLFEDGSTRTALILEILCNRTQQTDDDGHHDDHFVI